MADLAEEKRDPLGAFRLPSVSDLEGKTLEFDIEGGDAVFTLGDKRGSVVIHGDPLLEIAEGSLDVVRIRDGVYMVDLDIDLPARDGMTLVMDENTGWALLVHARRVPAKHLWDRGPECEMAFFSCRIRGKQQIGEAPAPTKDLNGAREFVLMGPENVYEHIYISHEYMVVNHVHTNVARGKAEVQPAHYYKLGPDLYVIGVCERDNATGLIQVIDYKKMKMTGKAHHAVDRWKSVSRGLGGDIIVVNGKLNYPKGLEPTGYIPDPE